MILKNVDKQEKNTAVFEVETDAAEFEKAVNEAYLKNRSSISIPGFRKGKAPRAVIEGMYGREVFYQEAMDELQGVTLESIVIATRTARAVRRLAERGVVSLNDYPLLMHVDAIINEGAEVNIPWEQFTMKVEG